MKTPHYVIKSLDESGVRPSVCDIIYGPIFTQFGTRFSVPYRFFEQFDQNYYVRMSDH